jgi:hypothetical protein
LAYIRTTAGVVVKTTKPAEARPGGAGPAESRPAGAQLTGAPPAAQIRELFAGLAGRLDAVAPAITRRIRAEIPGYGVLASDEHAEDVDQQIRNVVTGMVTGSVPGAAAVEHANRVGRRRAAAGMTLPDVIEAYHIAYREIWAEVLGDAQRHDPPLDGALASVVGLLWLWFHRFSAAVAEGHSAETQARRGDRLALERELIDQLTGRIPLDDAILAALGYRSDAEFTVLCVAGLGRSDGAERLQEILHKASQRVTCTRFEGQAVILAQDITAAEICAAIGKIRPTARIGIGIPRAGLAGAAVSLRDAQEAAARTTGERRVVEFEQDWLMSCLNAVKPRFAEILQPVMAVARRQPELADTVLAYAACRYSVSACARQLHIHPNTARYRLDRWKELTGHDVESIGGLAASVIALELAP